MTLKVKDVMKTKVKVTTRDTSVVDAVKIMAKHKIGSVVIVSDSSALGIVTSTDVLYKAIAKDRSIKKTKVGEIMNSPLVVITPDKNLHEAADLMAKNNVKKLPVIDGDGALVGIITMSDIIAHSHEFLDVFVNLMIHGTEKEVGG